MLKYDAFWLRTSMFADRIVIWAVPSEKGTSGICGQRRPRSACASAQSDQGLRCPLTESLDTIECMNGEQMPGWNFTHVRYESMHFAHPRTHFRLVGPISCRMYDEYEMPLSDFVTSLIELDLNCTRMPRHPFSSGSAYLKRTKAFRETAFINI